MTWCNPKIIDVVRLHTTEQREMGKKVKVDEYQQHLTYMIREVEQELVDNQRMRDNLLRKHTDLCNIRTDKSFDNIEWSR